MSGQVAAAETASVHERLVANIQCMLRRKCWSANQLADFSGVGRGFLSDVLNMRKSPTVRTLEKIADALCVEVRDLFWVGQSPGSTLGASATAIEERRAGRGGRGTTCEGKAGKASDGGKGKRRNK